MSDEGFSLVFRPLPLALAGRSFAFDLPLYTRKGSDEDRAVSFHSTLDLFLSTPDHRQSLPISLIAISLGTPVRAQDTKPKDPYSGDLLTRSTHTGSQAS